MVVPATSHLITTVIHQARRKVAAHTTPLRHQHRIRLRVPRVKIAIPTIQVKTVIAVLHPAIRTVQAHTNRINQEDTGTTKLGTVVPPRASIPVHLANNRMVEAVTTSTRLPRKVAEATQDTGSKLDMEALGAQEDTEGNLRTHKDPMAGLKTMTTTNTISMVVHPTPTRRLLSTSKAMDNRRSDNSNKATENRRNQAGSFLFLPARMYRICG